MPRKPKKLIDPDKLLKVKNYVKTLPAETKISAPTAYARAAAGELPSVYIDKVLHIITD